MTVARPGSGPAPRAGAIPAAAPVAAPDRQAVRELAAALTEAKDGGWPTLILDDTDFHGTLHTVLPSAVHAAWNSGRLGSTRRPGPGPLWWTIPDQQPGRTLLADLAAGLGHPVPCGADASVWVTDHLLRGVPLLVLADVHRLRPARTPRTSPVTALYDITRHAPATLLVVTGTATRATLAAMPDAASFLGHATHHPDGPRLPEPLRPTDHNARHERWPV
ncbi:hypothetical protein GCM10027168_41550 [Streptomyces capparidis]